MKNPVPQWYGLHFKRPVATCGWWVPYWTVQLYSLVIHLTHHKPKRWELVTEEAV